MYIVRHLIFGHERQLRCACRRAEKLKKDKELELQEREKESRKQRQVEIERKLTERREVLRLSKSFSMTLEGSLVLSIPPEVTTSTHPPSPRISIGIGHHRWNEQSYAMSCENICITHCRMVPFITETMVARGIA